MFYTADIQMADATDATDSITPPRNDKRERKHTAQTLPQGITHNMMKKFVVYYREITYLKSGKQQPREYFKVESHPKLSKPWVSSKSAKIPLFEKLNHANQVVADLESQSEKHTGLAVAETHQEEEEYITRVIDIYSYIFSPFYQRCGCYYFYRNCDITRETTE